MRSPPVHNRVAIHRIHFSTPVCAVLDDAFPRGCAHVGTRVNVKLDIILNAPDPDDIFVSLVVPAMPPLFQMPSSVGNQFMAADVSELTAHSALVKKADCQNRKGSSPVSSRKLAVQIVRQC